jgi:hypothetical protein
MSNIEWQIISEGKDLPSTLKIRHWIFDIGMPSGYGCELPAAA